jgi:hypothetical protein
MKWFAATQTSRHGRCVGAYCAHGGLGLLTLLPFTFACDRGKAVPTNRRHFDGHFTTN